MYLIYSLNICHAGQTQSGLHNYLQNTQESNASYSF